MRKILMMVAVAVMAAACGGKGGGKADGPEAVVTAFSKAVAAGQWEEAYGLCDTLSMKEYILHLIHLQHRYLHAPTSNIARLFLSLKSR